jgi:hypothetical protein
MPIDVMASLRDYARSNSDKAFATLPRGFPEQEPANLRFDPVLRYHPI